MGAQLPRAATPRPIAPPVQRRMRARSSILARCRLLRRGESGGGGRSLFLPWGNVRRLPQSFDDPLSHIADRDEAMALQGPRASSDPLASVSALHVPKHGVTEMKATTPKTASELSTHSTDAVEAAVLPAVQAMAATVPIKTLARDLDVSIGRAKQIRAGDTLPGIGPLILAARRYPALREQLVRLMHAEMGDGGKSPAEILADIARMVR